MRNYDFVLSGVVELLDAATRTTVQAVNSVMTATYWEIGRRIVEFEQGGERRAEYGEGLLDRQSNDLTHRFGRGFARPNLIRFRQFYSAFQPDAIRSTLSTELSGNRSTASKTSQMASAHSSPFALTDLARAFPLPRSHYFLLPASI